MENTKRKNQRGAMMVFFAILLPFLFGLMGLAIDASVLYLQRGKLQDVADAAALAGAAHLGDVDRQKGVADAVLAYVEGNGFNVNSMKDLADTSAPTQKGTTYVNWGIVEVDGVDRVRVRITQGVPVYFVSVLLDNYRQSGVNVTSVAAATGEINAVAPAKAAIIGQSKVNLYGSKIHGNDDNNGRGFQFDIYGKNFYVYDKKFMTEADVYAENVKQNGNIDGVQFKKPGEAHDVNDSTDEKVQEMNDYVSTTVQKYSDIVSKIKDSDYGSGNKIFISGNNGVIVVKPDGFSAVSDVAYDVYLDASTMANEGDKRIVIDNLAGIKKVKTLAIKSGSIPCVLNTSGITYGDVYGLTDNIYIHGKNNIFEGVIYADKEISVAGEGTGNNCNTYYQLIADVVNIGLMCDKNGKRVGVDQSWKCYFKTPQGVDGGGSSGVTSKLRLVE